MSGAAWDAIFFLAVYTRLKPVNQWSLRGAYVSATLATLFWLAAGPAYAHLEIRPGLVEQGAISEVRIELPQLRPGSQPTRLEVEGAGIEILSTRPQGTVGVGSETAWSVRLRANAAPAVVPLVLRAVYADGRSVEVDERLTVVPAQAGPGFPWPGIVVGVGLALAFAGVSLYLARRKA